MTNSSEVFPPQNTNEKGDITSINDSVIEEITKKIESRFNGKFSDIELGILKGLIYLAYNKCQKENRAPEISDLIKAIERTEKTLSGEEQIRNFKDLKEKLVIASR